MLPVTSLNGLAIGDGTVGKIYELILKEWSQNSGVDIKGQIKRWDVERGDEGGSSAPTPYRFKSK